MVLPSTSPEPSVIESQDKSLEENQSKIDNKISKDQTVRPLVRSKKTFPKEGFSNTSATISGDEVTTTPTQDISSSQPASTTSLCARTQITSLLFSFLLFLSSY